MGWLLVRQTMVVLLLVDAGDRVCSVNTTSGGDEVPGVNIFIVVTINMSA